MTISDKLYKTRTALTTKIDDAIFILNGQHREFVQLKAVKAAKMVNAFTKRAQKAAVAIKRAKTPVDMLKAAKQLPIVDDLDQVQDGMHALGMNAWAKLIITRATTVEHTYGEFKTLADRWTAEEKAAAKKPAKKSKPKKRNPDDQEKLKVQAETITKEMYDDEDAASTNDADDSSYDNAEAPAA